MKAESPFRVEDLFKERAASFALYESARRLVESIGPVTVRVTKTQVAFAVSRQFAWVWLPPAWARNRPQECIVLSFAARQQIEHTRIVQVVQPYPGRWMHHVIIEQESDLDEQIEEWMVEAYAFGQDL